MKTLLNSLSYLLIISALIPLFFVTSIGYISLGDGSHNLSIVERFYLWNVALSQFNDAQFFGGGFGLPFLTGYENWDGHQISYPYAHNIVLNSMAWSGYMGVFFLGAIFFVLVKISKLHFKDGTYLSVLPICFVFYVFSWSIMDGALQAMWLSNFIFWLSVAMLVRLNPSQST